MYRPPLRNRPVLADKKVLLIDRCQATREVRTAVLRSQGVEVHEAERSPPRDFSGNPMCPRPVLYYLPILEEDLLEKLKTSTRQVEGVTIVDLSGRITLGEASVVVRFLGQD